MRMKLAMLLMAAFLLGTLHVASAAPAAEGAAAVAAPAAADGQKVKGQNKWMEQLTPEQRTELQAKIKELNAAGKTKQEIRTSVLEMLKGWGVKARGGGQGAKAGRGGQLGGIMAKLTDEQRKQLQDELGKLRAAGKTPEEIRAACAEMLKGWGIEMPQGGQAGGQRALMQKLTPEQRQQVRAKIKELRDAGKTPPEIKAAVLEMLKGLGVQPPAQ